MSIQLTSFGAAGGVTGSCHLVETDHARLLLDCGLLQGGTKLEERNREPFGFVVGSLDAVILSHAHLDHAGLLPKLVARGYKGKIHCTRATRDLLAVMLKDAAYLEKRDVDWQNRRRKRSGKREIEPLFTFDDVRRVLRQCRGADYDKPVRVAPGVDIRFRDAGHILGSAHVCLDIDAGAGVKTIVFSGDIGQWDSALMNDPNPPGHADAVIMESTYGNRDHKSRGDTVNQFADLLAKADRDGGNVLIPAFAVGRSQEIIYQLLMLRAQNRLPQKRIFLDSPMAIEVSELYLDYMEQLDDEDLAALGQAGSMTIDQLLEFVQPTRTAKDSMALNRISDGAIIIAASGMCTGGRIRHHLKHNLWKREADVVFVGYQAHGTLGRRLIDGAQKITLMGEEIAVRAGIHTLGGYSAHAGRSDLLKWAGMIGGGPKFFLVHGEPEALLGLQAGLRDTHGIDAHIQERAESVELA